MAATAAGEEEKETAHAALGPEEVGERAEEEEREEQREEDGGGDEDGELVEDQQLRAEEHQPRAHRGHRAPHNADAHLPEGVAHLVAPGRVVRLHVVVGQVHHVVHWKGE